MPAKTVNLPANVPTPLLDSHSEDRQVRVHVTGANPATFAGPDVTVANGFHVLAGAEDTLQVDAGDRLFGVSALGTTVDVDG